MVLLLNRISVTTCIYIIVSNTHYHSCCMSLDIHWRLLCDTSSSSNEYSSNNLFLVTLNTVINNTLILYPCGRSVSRLNGIDNN